MILGSHQTFFLKKYYNSYKSDFLKSLILNCDYSPLIIVNDLHKFLKPK